MGWMGKDKGRKIERKERKEGKEIGDQLPGV